MAARRVIAHLDMDSFYVAVELLRRPELRGKPVIVAGGGPRAVVTTASYEARPYGVGSAMPVAHARRRCPDLIHLPVDMAHYREMSGRVMKLIGELEVPTQPVSLDEVYLDLSELPDPIARMSGLVRAIRERLALDASVGVGPNKLVAKMASDCEKPRGFVVLSREQAATRFAPDPPRLIPGIGPKTAERLTHDRHRDDRRAPAAPRRGPGAPLRHQPRRAGCTSGRTSAIRARSPAARPSRARSSRPSTTTSPTSSG